MHFGERKLKQKSFKQFRETVDNLLLGKGMDSKAIHKYDTFLALDNIRNLPLYSHFLLVMYGMLMPFKCIIHGVDLYNIVPFLISAAIATVIMYISRKYRNARKNTVKISRFLKFSFSTNILAIAMFYDLIIQSEEYDVYLLIAIVMISGMFNTYPFDQLIFLVCALSISIVIEAQFSPEHIFKANLLNAIIITIAGMILSITEMRTKIELIMIKEQEHKANLSDLKTQIVLNQIKPHFLYNVLSTIRALCHMDTDKAVDAIDDFSGYLRANIDYGLSKSVVTFIDELENVKYYLRLEKMRYGDKINIVFNLKEKNFHIPVLTLQPIVENAVKHGIGNKKGGGTVTVSTTTDEENIIITVADNGVGFSEAQKSDDKKSHIGLSNVRERIEVMTGGSLEIQSQGGVGTVVTIKIPKLFKEDDYEYTRS